MKLKQQLIDDIKAAMLSGDKEAVTTLRGLKSSILNVEVAEGVRDTGLSDEKIVEIFIKEAKKRQEAADLYKQVGNETKAEQELAEKKIIQNYLPKQLSEDELRQIITEIADKENISELSQMGQLISKVKASTGGSADGSFIAKLSKEYLQK